MTKPSRLKWFLHRLWNMDAIEFFSCCLWSFIALSFLIVPDFAYIVWSNYIIGAWAIGEIFYLGIWKDGLRRPTKSELLSEEVGELKKEAETQKELLGHKVCTIEKLVEMNREFRRVVNKIKSEQEKGGEKYEDSVLSSNV